MAENATPTPPDQADNSGPQLEAGTYEIIRGRLLDHGKTLRGKLDRLNSDRKEVFGSVEAKLTGSSRITTENNCDSRDMIAVGERFIFGYNVFIGLRAETTPADVFAVYQYQDEEFTACKPDLIDDDRFRTDFANLYKYYRRAQFAKFAVLGPHLFMIFRVGENVGDVKTFKWLMHDGALQYVDNRSDHEYRFPAQHEFEWRRVTHEMHRAGLHPHIAIDNRVFVETVGGDFTVKIEDNTATGEGIFSDPVKNPDQTLDDAEIYFALIDSIILLKVRPYQEDTFRYVVYNEKIQRAIRIDSIEDACVLLPDGHGLIFPEGYYLQNGEQKLFDSDMENMVFEKRLASPNGEDHLYVFYNRDSGTYVLLSYNLIRQQVDSPMVCHGYSLFDDGTLICFRAEGQSQKHHVVQVWRTPYYGPDHTVDVQADSYLNKIGNKDIVRCMAECTELINLIAKEDTYANLYVDIAKKAGDISDAYFWLNTEETYRFDGPLVEIKAAANSAIDEFDKVVRTKRNTQQQVGRVSGEVTTLIRSIDYDSLSDINEFVRLLAELRTARGEIISLKDLRYADTVQIVSLDEQVATHTDELSNRCVEFLLLPDSLKTYHTCVDEQGKQIPELTKAAGARELGEQVAQTASELEMLTEIVSNLKIDDATQTTAIIDSISLIYQRLNQVKSALKNKTAALGTVEGKAEFTSQMKLIDQAVANYLDVCDTPEKCDEYLTRVMVQMETLEAKFADFDEFIGELSEKREGLYNAFESRKVQLVEKRNRRAAALETAGKRILKGIGNRVAAMSEINEINGYFASDLMIERLRETISQLTGLGDNVKAEGLASELKSVQQDAIRQLKDRKALYEDGENIIRFGTHRFGVNTQDLELTTVQRGDEMFFHLTGTGFFERIDDEQFAAMRGVWSQEVVSENDNVYRAEYLAKLLFDRATTAPPAEQQMWFTTAEELLPRVQDFLAPRYNEGYVKGVHDRDAAMILAALLKMHAGIGLLRYAPEARALGLLMWQCWKADDKLAGLATEIVGLGHMREVLDYHGQERSYIDRLAELTKAFNDAHGTWSWHYTAPAAEYLFFELAEGGGPVVSEPAAALYKRFCSFLAHKDRTGVFRNAVAEVASVPGRFELARKWLRGFLAESEDADGVEYVDEVAVRLIRSSGTPRIIDEPTTVRLTGMLGSHKRIADAALDLEFCDFMFRLAEFQESVVPKFTACGQRKKDLIAAFAEDLRLSEFEPRVLTTFVRNRLIDKVYLQLVGDNLAKQMGSAGGEQRTDRQGLLLLISPPGYGKTTLMEYIASRLGLTFVKINGPALGHSVTSLDPSEAANAASREEVEKLNLAFEMGDNVMIYVDDIQHCNPEFLQKFISLCDAQRRVEGVYKGRSRTYDLRGKRVAVVMAGNPYTESGEKFRIPDMLSNRADTYNIGDIVGDNYDVFIDSYIENSLTSNPVLGTLANRSQQDVYAIMQIAQTGQKGDLEFEGNYSADEMDEYVNTMKKLYVVREVLLKVNQQYIRSAGQADEYRTEPPFLLQGSYRNMNRIASRVLPVMNEDELWTLILSSYEQDSQTLTTGAESNLLKFKELIERMSDDEAARWEQIKKTFGRNQLLGGDSDDKVAQVIRQLNAFSAGLDSIRDAITTGAVGGDGKQRKAEAQRVAEAERQAVAAQRQTIETQQAAAEALSGKLDAIGSALTKGVEKLTTTPAATAGNDGTLNEIKTVGTDVLAKLNDVIAAIRRDSQLQHETAERHEALTINDNAQTLMAVLEEQFQTMETWLRPVTRNEEARGTYIQGLIKRFEKMVGGYNRLVGILGGMQAKADGQPVAAVPVDGPQADGAPPKAEPADAPPIQPKSKPKSAKKKKKKP